MVGLLHDMVVDISHGVSVHAMVDDTRHDGGSIHGLDDIPNG